MTPNQQTASNYHLIGDELLISVFKDFPKEKKLNFKDESNIMLAFYKMSKEEKYKDLYNNYHFDEDGIFPYSYEIADGINILHQSSLLGKLNPAFSYHTLSKGIDFRFEKFISNKLSTIQKTLISELSKEIERELLEK